MLNEINIMAIGYIYIQEHANVEEQHVVPVKNVLHRVVFVKRLQPVATLMVLLKIPQTVDVALQPVPIQLFILIFSVHCLKISVGT